MKKVTFFLIVFLVMATFCYADETIGLTSSYPGDLLTTKTGNAALIFHETQAKQGVYTNTVTIRSYDKDSGAVAWSSNFADLTDYNFSYCKTDENEIVLVFRQKAEEDILEMEYESAADGSDSDGAQLKHQLYRLVSVDLSTGGRNWSVKIDGNINTLESAPEGGWYVRYNQYDNDKVIEYLSALSSSGVVLWSNVIQEQTLKLTDPTLIPADETSSEIDVLKP
jgi:hypothetical protein